VCLNDNGRLIRTDALDRFIAIDWERGVVRAEAGMSFDALSVFENPEAAVAFAVPPQSATYRATAHSRSVRKRTPGRRNERLQAVGFAGLPKTLLRPRHQPLTTRERPANKAQ
jgi:hypothetical protein